MLLVGHDDRCDPLLVWTTLVGVRVLLRVLLKLLLHGICDLCIGVLSLAGLLPRYWFLGW